MTCANFLPLIFLAAASPLVTGCAAQGVAIGETSTATLNLDELTTLDCATGRAASWKEVLWATLSADVILLAELHGHPTGLLYHQKVFEQSLERDANAALCLEFVTRDWQYLMDAWAAGIVDGDAVVATLDPVPSNSADSHRPLIELAHQHGVPVVAANSPRIYTRAAKESGFESLLLLNPEQQRLFHVPEVLPSGPYRDGFFRMMREFETADNPTLATEMEDQDPSPELEAKFRSQTLWDGTMADSVLGALDAGAGRAFLAVGSYHANNNGGIVQVLKNRRPELKVLVVSFVDELAPGETSQNAAPSGTADFLTFVGPFPH